MILRPYQEMARERVHEAWRTFQRVLLVQATGTGKTIVFSAISKDAVAAGGRVLILAHRGKLLEQAADKLSQATGLMCAVEKADSTAHDAMERVTVGSIQTMMRPDRLARFAENHYTHIICDEAHHCLSPSWQAALKYFGGAKVLGVTATPDRGDKRNLGQYFETLAFEYSIQDAIRDGYLCKMQALTIPIKIDLSAVAVTAGDFQDKALDHALAPYLDQIAAEMVARCANRKTLVFLPLIATAQKFAAMLAARGLQADWTSGVDGEQDAKVQAFEAAKTGVLCNSMLLTEGYDCPDVDCIVSLRPTKVRSLFAQIIGRGTRIHPGKERLLILDFLWQCEKHDLCRPAHLLAESPDVAKKATEMAQESGGPVELSEELMEQAAGEVAHERELALAKQLREMRNRKSKLVDPLQWIASIGSADLMEYQPTFGAEMMPPTKGQLDALEKAGIFAADVPSQGMASRLLDKIGERRDGGFATPKQVRCLEKYGFRHVGGMKFEEAKRLIDRIAGNGWRLPPDMWRMRGAA